ncbi:MAG TPA: thermonuclease family protein [Burkholderiales bacterium]|nr:thermonuclease family protein [Burkholderiales bacterium]
MPDFAGMTNLSPLRLFPAALGLSLFLAASPAPADVQGRVVSVHDGDTLTVLIESRSVRVRLTDIDAPELRQPFGTRSRQSLSSLCFGKVASLDVRGQDRYNRTLARVTCSGTDANAEQVRRGYAWTFTRYARTDSPLFAIEHEARAAHRGLWQDPAPVAPWEWRNRVRQSSRSSFLGAGS